MRSATGDGFARVFTVVSPDANVTPSFLLCSAEELGEVPELVMEHFLESDDVQLVEHDLVDELVPAAVPALLSPLAAEEVAGGFEEGVARVDVVADVEAADAESRSRAGSSPWCLSRSSSSLALSLE